MTSYDGIVLGIGGVGSAALFHLASRGAKVLGLDRFPPGHDRGSSHGQTRLIRQAYYEHPDYVPLVRRAFTLWGELEALSGQRLYHQVGLLQIGPAAGEVLSGVRRTAREHQLPIENLSPEDCRERFPGFRVPDDWEAIFETRAGYLFVERAVLAHIEQAEKRGAEIKTGAAVRRWRAEAQGVVVETDGETFRADRLVIAAGPWAGEVLAGLNIPLEVRRKQLFWWPNPSGVYHADRGCPGFVYDLPRGFFYGIPAIDALGVKAAEHTGGDVVSDPLSVDRTCDESSRRRVAEFVAEFLPEALKRPSEFTTCMYTMTRDAHFVVDRHPAHPQVAFAAGLSGHGFKFTCVLGEALAQLALDGHSNLPMGFLSAGRPGLKEA